MKHKHDAKDEGKIYMKREETNLGTNWALVFDIVPSGLFLNYLFTKELKDDSAEVQNPLLPDKIFSNVALL